MRVASAVAAFQRVNGLPATGALTAGTARRSTAASANAGGSSCILANMEMWRWEPRDMGEERVEVNVPDFRSKVTKGDEVVHRARVIVGKPDTPTPIFSNPIKYLLFNPAWRVPDSIIKKEMVPKLANDPDYLTRARLQGHLCRRHSSMVGSRPASQRARPYAVHVSQRARGLSARHAGALAVFGLVARAQPRLRAGRRSGAAWPKW